MTETDIRRDAMLATMRLMERTGDMTMTDLCSGLERLGFDLMNADRATAARKVADLVKDDPEAACILLEGLVLMCGCAKTFEAAKKEADSYASRN